MLIYVNKIEKTYFKKILIYVDFMLIYVNIEEKKLK